MLRFLGAFLLFALLQAVPQPALAGETASQQTIAFDIPRQRADLALIEFARQADVTFIFPFDAARRKIANPLVGNYTREEAIRMLLRSTGLLPEFETNGALSVRTQNDSGGKLMTASTGRTARQASFIGVVAAFLTGVMTAPGAAAQDARESGARAAVLEEIIVTATKLEKSEFDVPVSLEVVTGETIRADGIRNLDDLSARIPNVTFANGVTQATISIRGQGSGADRSFEQSVAMFIDDVYMPRSRQYRMPFFDIERVEILRGPQALMFGLNATAGTVNITTATTKPGDERFVELSAGYEVEYDGFNVSGIAGGTLADNIGARLAVRYSDTGDGYYRNEFTGKDENHSEDLLIRGSAVWEATPNLTITPKVTYVQAEEFGNFGEAFGLLSGLFGDGRLNFVRNSDARYLRITTSNDPGLKHELINASLRFDYDFGGHTFTGIGSYSISDYDYAVEIGNLPANLNTQAAALFEELDQISGEFRIASSADRTISYLAGIFVAESEISNVQPNSYGTPLVGGHPGLAADVAGGVIPVIRNSSMAATKTSTLSLFGSLTWNVTDTFRLTAGVRYSDEEKENRRATTLCQLYTGTPATGFTFVRDLSIITFANQCGTLDGFRDSRDSSNWMPEFVAQWDFIEGSTAYAKAGTSAKSGGYAFGTSVLADLVQFDDETAQTVELGVKSRFLGGRASLKVAGYYTVYEDLQLTSFEFVGANVVAAIRNAGESEAKGFELEIDFAATEWLTAGISIAYLDSEFTDYTNGVCYIGETATRDPVTGSCNKNGQRTPNAPEYSGSVFADIAYPLGSNLLLTGGVTLSFSDEFYTTSTIDPAAIQDGFTRWDARFGIASADQRWELSVIGRNLSNEVINNFTQPLGAITYLGYPYPARTITLQGTYRF